MIKALIIIILFLSWGCQQKEGGRQQHNYAETQRKLDLIESEVLSYGKSADSVVEESLSSIEDATNYLLTLETREEIEDWFKSANRHLARSVYRKFEESCDGWLSLVDDKKKIIDRNLDKKTKLSLIVKNKEKRLAVLKNSLDVNNRSDRSLLIRSIDNLTNSIDDDNGTILSIDTLISVERSILEDIMKSKPSSKRLEVYTHLRALRVDY